MSAKTVIITGASRGIGAAAAREFAAAGWRVALLARSEREISALSGQIGAAAMALPCDVADQGAMQAAVQTVLARWGRLDTLINNAGMIDPIARLADADADAWGRSVDVNLKGVFHGMRAAIPVMKAAGGGTIITISSGAASNPYEGWSAYCAAKAGAAMLTRAAHLEEGENGLRIMGLSPGTVATEMQIRIKASGINPVSALDPAVHVPADWPAKCLLWMCGPGGDPWLGEEVKLRDESIRRAIGVIE
ncbi:SDR family oxidoreductase [Pseudotabrizicola alkalilacus]|uniref:SDR family NAD(P)-dependent oxidoreductase n=1 Tax=Pseudotabrizicola alkalilacus TaxID=2305252 RepID=A0A411Z3B3_9RHOB|nr:SDR family NAD(P)-dependent oxidoreductase [Pseudotabrizicola alkalilacus]RGP37535.1 SDR family NAD(P)-dependent oxidoreductase [Pseudotabrizicola alkalilacus]